jgi:hypothetical protein
VLQFVGPSSLPLLSEGGIASNSTQYVGAALALPHALFTRDDRIYAFFDITFGRFGLLIYINI